jgi:phospholipid-translocating ATPase
MINFTGNVTPRNYQKNIVKNTKYNIITFVPLVLYDQFKFFINMFFLVTALTQLIPALQVGLIITYLGPLILVLTLTMAK